MKSRTLIYPHQLFAKTPALQNNTPVYLIEDPLFFGDDEYPGEFCKQKLVLHRASMKKYAKKIEEQSHSVQYFDYVDDASPKRVFTELEKEGIDKIYICDVCDDVLQQRIEHFADAKKIEIVWHRSPNFLTDAKEGRRFVEKENSKMADFYVWQRKRLGVLLENDEKPVGGKWSFDEQNRKKLPKEIDIPDLPKRKEDDAVTEAKHYVEENFANNPGKVEQFFYPTDSGAATEWFDDFLKHRLSCFGPYEDALSKAHAFQFHAVLTPMLNIGLLNPEQIIEKTLAHAKNCNIPLNSLEGFLRQIIGWREYMRLQYLHNGRKMRSRNFFEHSNKLPNGFYNATTGIDPVDHVIEQVLKTGYAHHIERLMVLGNFMLLCEIDPNDVYRWFMEMFIDSYDWVMVPNVYGMSQFAAGGMMTTKPYISGSNYLKKMSDYKNGDWQKTWDGLYWRFIEKHSDFFLNNPRLSMMPRMWQKMSDEKQKSHLANAEEFLKRM
jgi:deoxyribodipyrimidine photolyase-related protein